MSGRESSTESTTIARSGGIGLEPPPPPCVTARDVLWSRVLTAFYLCGRERTTLTRPRVDADIDAARPVLGGPDGKVESIHLGVFVCPHSQKFGELQVSGYLAGPHSFFSELHSRGQSADNQSLVSLRRAAQHLDPVEPPLDRITYLFESPPCEGVSSGRRGVVLFRPETILRSLNLPMIELTHNFLLRGSSHRRDHVRPLAHTRSKPHPLKALMPLQATACRAPSSETCACGRWRKAAVRLRFTASGPSLTLSLPHRPPKRRKKKKVG